MYNNDTSSMGLHQVNKNITYNTTFGVVPKNNTYNK